MTENAVHVYGKKFLVYLCNSIKEDGPIFSDFAKAVQMESNDEMLKTAFSEVVDKYMMLVTAHFRSNYLRSKKLKRQKLIGKK